MVVMNVADLDNCYNDMCRDYNCTKHNEAPKLPKKRTKNAQCLTYLWKNKGEVMLKHMFDILYRKDTQQPRHLGKQSGFKILSGGYIINGRVLKEGEYCFCGFEELHPFYSEQRRKENFENLNWDDIKKIYSNECAHCGSIEGELCKKDKSKITKLEKGHRDPREQLNLENIIPLCEYCNRYYGDRVVFGKNGCIDMKETEIMNKSRDDL